ncbi:MAG: cytochrome ubiquinol oxidase subunit I [Bacteroidia bacterium]|nr:cytochrome ubiquinol oxidase subunit I [Bacteroidia bacterium]MDW8302889.1 cytochrome ubiquinol oxidase subunit I [Bacteroidia bacterium]
MAVEILARIQFAFTAAFHYLYPPMSIGLGVVLVIMEAMYLRTKQRIYKHITKFWVKIFALTFAIGVASGIVMEFEFGTNWATYSRYVGDVFGSPLAAEGIFAFFLESGFLAILVFGWNKVGPITHFISTVMVALGATLSSVWIVVANSWMQTPAGYRIVGEGMNARAEIIDFWAVVFNPSSMERLTHVILGSWLTGAFVVISISAYYLRKKIHEEFAIRSMKIGLVVAFIAMGLQFISGHVSATGVAKNQPEKLAAMEGHFEADAPADLYLFGWVDTKNQTTKGIALPNMLSFLVHGDTNTPIKGLKAFPKEDLPPIQATFQFYHLMLFAAFLMAIFLIAAGWLWYKGKLWTNKTMLTILTLSVVLPHIANQAGWFAAEIGRQPWIVYKMLRTSEALSKSVMANQVLWSLIMFMLVYLLLFALFLFLLNEKVKAGPFAKVEVHEQYRDTGDQVAPWVNKITRERVEQNVEE